MGPCADLIPDIGGKPVKIRLCLLIVLEKLVHIAIFLHAITPVSAFAGSRDKYRQNAWIIWNRIPAYPTASRHGIAMTKTEISAIYYEIKEGIGMGILGWVIIGALAGWIASKLTGNDKQMGAGANIITGIVGGFLGGLVMNLLGGAGVTGFNLWSLFVSVIGAVILLWIVNSFRRKK